MRLAIRCAAAGCVLMWVGVVLAQVSTGRGRPSERGPGRAGRAQRRPSTPPQHPLLATFDTDKNGEISADEMDKAPASLKRLDRNSDGKLTREEIRPQRGPFGGLDRGGRPPAFRRDGQSIAERPMFMSKPLPKNDEEKRILAVLKDMDINQRRGNMNVPERDGRLLRLLTESIGAKTVVEIGTSTGYSGIWFCLALRKTGGKLITHDIDPHRAGIARENFKRAGVDDLVTLVLGDAHETVTKLEGPIDVLFLDADKQGYLDYLDKLLPLVRPGGLVIAHNMNERQADPKFVKAITTNPNLETLFLHMDATGVGVSMKKH